ncbi:ion channel [Paenibacillus sp. J5C_2022]|uniref:potassium channel protein n=1 Tax=Paenibacillus sp. J5C2022 TaxID=2977129 RepID=UPI0021CF5086|nr:potassium channel family protein [Paenibacillus sp. J5C2022]MCU6710605.1 ion channel [Paenibacillus sp. J5C2022]
MHFIRLISTRLMRMSRLSIAVIIVLVVLSSATISYALEPDTFGSWFNALYWVLTTMATVGYGDFYPATVAGKVWTMLLYIFGIGMLSLVIGKIIDSIALIQKKRGAGKLSYSGSDHIVIINWSKKAQTAVEEILSCQPKREIVIVDEGNRHPQEHLPTVHFVSGDPAEDDVLAKAGIERAKSAIIFSDIRIDESALIDGKSLLIASSVERIAPQVHTTVEIMQEKHIRNFHHVQVNEFVLSHDAISRLAVRSALHEGNSEVLRQLLSRQYGDDIYEVPVNRAWKTYGDAFRGLLEQGATLISDRGDLSINRKLGESIPSGARLFIICDSDTYQRLAK